MKYIDEFRDRRLIDGLARRIRQAVDKERQYSFMEVCGTHTNAIFKFGIRDILPDNIKLISGPGCPVCVTPNEFLDKAIWIANQKDVVIATFGDMLKVPGSRSSLEKERSRGSSVKVVYSTDEALILAEKNPAKEIVFLGIGFETTAPAVAQSILAARKRRLKNYSVLCGHKTMPEVMTVLVKDGALALDGFLLPGHVSIVTGSKPYNILASRYKKRCVIAGFEPLDILQAILMLIGQNKPRVEIQYTRIIGKPGNATARKYMKRVFDKSDSSWRGIGPVKKSGLRIKKEFSGFDAEAKFNPKVKPAEEKKGCICGDILKGKNTPPGCVLFGKVCTPEDPVGSCMVSGEGTCAAYYKYGKI